jgi:hypothetical protein
MPTIQKHLIEILKDDACEAILQVFEPNVLPQRLIDYIQHLMDKNFDGLINLLYRIDVDENKIKEALKENKIQQSAAILTTLIIQRLEKIIKSREENQMDENDGSGEDFYNPYSKWI